jgi:hypothetical protein
VALQLGAKDQVYSSVYYMTLNPICVAQRETKILKKIVEDRVRNQNEQKSDLS